MTGIEERKTKTHLIHGRLAFPLNLRTGRPFAQRVFDDLKGMESAVAEVDCFVLTRKAWDQLRAFYDLPDDSPGEFRGVKCYIADGFAGHSSGVGAMELATRLQKLDLTVRVVIR